MLWRTDRSSRGVSDAGLSGRHGDPPAESGTAIPAGDTEGRKLEIIPCRELKEAWALGREGGSTRLPLSDCFRGQMWACELCARMRECVQV